LIKSNIVRSGLEDGFSYITGFPLTGTASNLLVDILLPRFHKKTLNNFLDWELKNWPHIYDQITDILTLELTKQTYRLPQQIVFDNTKKRLPLSKIKLVSLEQEFQIDPVIKAKTEEQFQQYLQVIKSLNRVYHNEKNVRLVDIDEHADNATLSVQNVFYEDYLRTNLMLDHDYDSNGSTLRKRLHAQKPLESMKLSPLANTIGINILLFTVDGKLVIQKRSSEVLVRPEEYCPSVSGTLSSGDIPIPDMPLSAVPLMREAEEELGYLEYDPTEIKLLGISRELIRGGQPELFLIVKCQNSAAQIKEKQKFAKGKFETCQLEFFDFNEHAITSAPDTPKDIADFFQTLEAFIEKYKELMSVPLWTALALWKKARLSHLNIN